MKNILIFEKLFISFDLKWTFSSFLCFLWSVLTPNEHYYFCIFWSSVVNLTRFKAMFHFYWVYWRNTCLKWVQELHANSVNVLRSIFLFLRYFRILSFNFRVSFILPLFLSDLLGKNKNLRQIYSGNVLLLFWYIFCELFYTNLTI